MSESSKLTGQSLADVEFFKTMVFVLNQKGYAEFDTQLKGWYKKFYSSKEEFQKFAKENLALMKTGTIDLVLQRYARLALSHININELKTQLNVRLQEGSLSPDTVKRIEKKFLRNGEASLQKQLWRQ